MSRKHTQITEHIVLTTGDDHIMGKFIHLSDNRITDDPTGEGSVFDYDEFGGVNYSRVYWDLKTKAGWNQNDRIPTYEEAFTFMTENFLTKSTEEDEENTEPACN